jgi:hypothetical protein
MFASLKYCASKHIFFNSLVLFAVFFISIHRTLTIDPSNYLLFPPPLFLYMPFLSSMWKNGLKIGNIFKLKSEKGGGGGEKVWFGYLLSGGTIAPR